MAVDRRLPAPWWSSHLWYTRMLYHRTSHSRYSEPPFLQRDFQLIAILGTWFLIGRGQFQSGSVDLMWNNLGKIQELPNSDQIMYRIRLCWIWSGLPFKPWHRRYLIKDGKQVDSHMDYIVAHGVIWHFFFVFHNLLTNEIKLFFFFPFLNLYFYSMDYMIWCFFGMP